VKAFPGRQGFCVRGLLHAAGKLDSRCGNAQPSRQTGASDVRYNYHLIIVAGVHQIAGFSHQISKGHENFSRA
jgi:hypothetical protein